MNRPLLQGRLVRLEAIDPETFAKPDAQWSMDSEYMRLLNSDPTRPWTEKSAKEEIEKWKIKNTSYVFAIRSLEDNQLIGFGELDGIRWSHADAWFAIGIGERSSWGKGYGTDATREILRFAFEELNLHRVTLNVFEYNTRAIRSYEKVGFVNEGRVRQFLKREGKRWDLIYYGILRSEWERDQVR